ncbi:MAG: outer membrane beta-barrel protein [Bacteroidetes bacterium]|jgi:hypothetical protein|nr:outer membrane beta-barrel protein [Bacteroidota bacterium]MDF1867073.1 outer membrane beta-barrel protein [Saprospiraceae bacterium]
MNHLDNFYKEKLNKREFEFDESLWLQAEELIVADEKKKKKRAIVWWILGGVLLISMIGGGLMLQNLNSNSGDLIKADYQDKAANIMDEKFSTNESTHEEAIEKVNMESSEKLEATTKKNTAILLPNTQKPNPTNKNKPSSKPEASEIIDDKIEQRVEIPIAISDTKENSTIEKESENTLNAHTTDEIANTNTQEKASGISESSVVKSGSAVEEIPKRITENIAQVSLLKLNPFFIKETKEIKALTTFKPEKTRKLQIGLVGSLVYFPNSKLDSELNYKGGMSIGVPLVGRWSLGTELSYFVFKEEMEAIGESPQAAFGYSGDYDTYQLRPSSLHFLNLPIYAKYQLGYHALECGLAFDYLLGARGELVLEDHLQSWERDDVQNQKYIQSVAVAASVNGQNENLNDIRYTENGVVQKGWLDDSALNKIQTQLLLGYNYRFNSKTALGIRAQYRLTNYNNPNNDFETTETDPKSVKNDTPLSVHFSIQYRIW